MLGSDLATISVQAEFCVLKELVQSGVSCGTNTYSASLFTLLFFPMQETKAMQLETPTTTGVH